MSTSAKFPVARRMGQIMGHLLGSISFTLFTDPIALLVAVVAAWLVAMGIIGVSRAEGHLLSYAVWLAAMVLVTALAAAHVMVTAVNGWGRVRSHPHLASQVPEPH